MDERRLAELGVRLIALCSVLVGFVFLCATLLHYVWFWVSDMPIFSLIEILPSSPRWTVFGLSSVIAGFSLLKGSRFVAGRIVDGVFEYVEHEEEP